MLKPAPHLSNHDLKFAYWLKRNKWDPAKTQYCDRPPINTFFNHEGKVIAKALYDNAKCTFEVFTV